MNTYYAKFLTTLSNFATAKYISKAIYRFEKETKLEYSEVSFYRHTLLDC